MVRWSALVDWLERSDNCIACTELNRSETKRVTPVGYRIGRLVSIHAPLVSIHFVTQPESLRTLNQRSWPVGRVLDQNLMIFAQCLTCHTDYSDWLMSLSQMTSQNMITIGRHRAWSKWLGVDLVTSMRWNQCTALQSCGLVPSRQWNGSAPSF